MAQEFDKIFKENREEFFHALARRVLGMSVVSSEEVNPNLETTIAREADYLRRVLTENQGECILHLEFQTNDDSDMVYRMAEYKGIMTRIHRIPVFQHVVYLGNGKSGMNPQLPPAYGIKGFDLHVLNKVDSREFLDSDIPEEIMLAILGDFRGEPAAEIIRKIINNLQRASGNDTLRNRYLKQLMVLGRLRKLGEEIFNQVEVMPILFDPALKKDDFLYKEGHEEGREEGREETQYETAKNLLTSTDLSVEQIADAVGTTVEFVEKIKQDLKK